MVQKEVTIVTVDSILLQQCTKQTGVHVGEGPLHKRCHMHDVPHGHVLLKLSKLQHFSNHFSDKCSIF